MAIRSSNRWPVEQLRQETTSATFRVAATGGWTTERAELHEEIINRLLAGKRRKTSPTICVVGGGVGSGKSTLIKSEVAPEHPGAVVIDADQLWVEIPEYEALAAADWRTAGVRTYAEVRYLRDAALAEAAARRLDIILEAPGDENLPEVENILERDGYEVSVKYVHCSPEKARQRMNKRANTEPTPEDNLWSSPLRPEFPDKYDYQNVDLEIFRQEYAKRKGRAQSLDEGDTKLRKRRTKSKAASPAMGSVPAVSAASDAPAFKAPPGKFSVLGVDEPAGKGCIMGECNTLDEAKAVADREAGPYGRYPETSVFDEKGQEVYKVQLRSRIAIADVWQGLGGRFLLDAYSLEKQYGGDSLDKVQARLQADGWASFGKGVRWDKAVVEDWRKGDQCIAVSDRIKNPVLLPHIEEVSVGEDDKCILQERHPADEMDDEIDVQEIEKGYEAEHQKRQQAGDDLGGLRRPSLMVVTGGPGSGKLALFNSIETLGSNPVRINPDDIRERLPEWHYLRNHPEGVKCLRREANYLAATIIGGVEAKVANIILQLPGRGRNADILVL